MALLDLGESLPCLGCWPNEEEKDLEEIFQDLSTDMNIFSYIVPAFTPGPNIKALLAWNDIEG